jgi:putative hemolysin
MAVEGVTVTAIHSLANLDGSLSSHRHLEVRLARSAGEVDAAQALRYTVFYEEMGATPSGAVRRRRRDADALDAVCDHLIVHDPLQADPEKSVVGTYRLNRLRDGRGIGDFYSASEFDLSPFAGYGGVLLELGRSCVAPAYRCRSVMQLLWRGVSDYVVRNGVELMFGCASLPGSDAAAHRDALAYLHRHHLAAPDIRVKALPQRRVEMAAGEDEAIDMRRALAGLPPLIKGYLRVGAVVGDGAVEDHQFGVTDICIIVETSRITGKYARRYVEASPAALAAA